MNTPKTLIEKTTDEIIQYIIDNDLKPNQKLPNEYELSQQLNVGRSTLRESVRSLVSRNILEVVHGSGTFVSSRKGVMPDPLGFALIKDQKKMISDLFDLRYLLEPEMASLAAQNASDQQVAGMEDMINKVELSFANNDDTHIEYDVKFHALIAEASGNIALFHTIPIINEAIGMLNKYYDEKDLKKETTISHRQIFEAIKNKNAAKAYEEMKKHIDISKKTVN